MDVSSLNYLAVLAAAVAGMVSGAMWYGIFAKPWMRAAGYTEEPVKAPKIYLVAAVAQLIIALSLALLFRHFPQVDITTGLISGFFLWLGFCVAPMAVNHRFQSMGWNLTLIDGGYWLAVFMLQGAIIGWLGA